MRMFRIPTMVGRRRGDFKSRPIATLSPACLPKVVDRVAWNMADSCTPLWIEHVGRERRWEAAATSGSRWPAPDQGRKCSHSRVPKRSRARCWASAISSSRIVSSVSPKRARKWPIR